MLRNHFTCTSSKVAREMLENWDIERQFFTKVMPRDYKAVLAKRAEKMKVDIKPALVS
jgi:glutamate synthase domain-containing protein 3